MSERVLEAPDPKDGDIRVDAEGCYRYNQRLDRWIQWGVLAEHDHLETTLRKIREAQAELGRLQRQIVTARSRLAGLEKKGPWDTPERRTMTLRRELRHAVGRGIARVMRQYDRDVLGLEPSPAAKKSDLAYLLEKKAKKVRQ